MTYPAEPKLTLGIEEEYLLVDIETRDLVAEPPPAFMEKCQDALGAQVSAEFLQAQIEIGTRVCANIQEARDDLMRLRRTVGEIAGEFGMAPVAASTHPFAHWAAQVHTHKERYDALLKDLAGTARRMLICGMHVHAGIDDDDLRIDLMNQVSYFVPHLLALSTSSPFWQGEDMGLMSYRMIVFDGLPRTGLPARFDSARDYHAFAEQLIRTQTIDDASKIWWDVRPSARFPTLEMRVMDVCTDLADAVTIAALYQCLLRYLYRLRRDNQTWRLYPLPLIDENRWRAVRYGADQDLIDFGIGERVAFARLVDELIDTLHDDAEALNCVAELEHAQEIVKRGTSAHRQLHLYTAARQAGALMVGKTNLDQFATGLVGVRSPYGVPRNALDPRLVPGGSSSGSALRGTP